MKKSGLVLIFVMLVLLLIPVINAGLLDWFKGIITGRATTGTSAANITVGNTAPTVLQITGIANQDPTEAGVRNVTFEANISDVDGTGNINGVRGSFTRGSERVVNLSCILVANVNATLARYQCTVGLNYFNANGAFNINVTAYDAAVASGVNTTDNYFTFNSLKAFVIGTNTSTAGLAWPTVTLISTNQTSNNDPLVLNNTGNANMSVGGINLTSINLFGEVTGTQYLTVSNMSVHTSTGGSCSGAGCDECGGNVSLVNATSVVVTLANMTKGNNTVNAGDTTSGQEQLYFCLRGIGSTATAQQSYSTNAAGAWTVTIT